MAEEDPLEAAEEGRVEDAAADRLGRGGAADDVAGGGAPRDDLEHEVVGEHLRRRPIRRRLGSFTPGVDGHHRYARARGRIRTACLVIDGQKGSHGKVSVRPRLYATAAREYRSVCASQVTPRSTAGI